MTTPTLVEQLVAKLAECEKADRVTSIAEERACNLRQEANALRAQILIAEAVRYLGPFQWDARFPGNGVCVLEAYQRAPGYDEAFSDLFPLCGFTFEHDGLELAEGATLRVDDGELRLRFDSVPRMVEVMQKMGLVDRIRIRELTFLIERQRQQAETLKASADQLEEVRDALSLDSGVSDES